MTFGCISNYLNTTGKKYMGPWKAKEYFQKRKIPLAESIPPRIEVGNYHMGTPNHFGAAVSKGLNV